MSYCGAQNCYRIITLPLNALDALLRAMTENRMFAMNFVIYAEFDKH